MSVTLTDISQALELSVSTVSKALNGYRDVAPETRDRVLSMAQAMGYHPNTANARTRPACSSTPPSWTSTTTWWR